MYHQLPEFVYAVSDRLSIILDGVGYSPKDRETKIKCATEYEVFTSIMGTFVATERTQYVFGSRGEGSTGPGLLSDIDFLAQSNQFKMLTDLSNCQAGNIYIHMMQDGITHPGYVKLHMVRILPDNTPVRAYPHHCPLHPFFALDSSGVVVLSNLDFYCRRGGNSGYRSGPAVHDPSEYISRDRVLAFRSSQWPREGYEWFHRRRNYRWPSDIQIQKTWKYGCFATPVGHPNSNEVHLEWRLSFSIAERDLVRSFEDTVMKVYILLKMVKKTFIEPVLEDEFSSYHCKVCMLWMRERTPSELWCTENLLFCLILCIRQLYEWAIAGVCPDYFIVRNNIYDRKIVGMTRMKLIQILERLLSDDCSFVCMIQCRHIGSILVDDLSSFEHRRIESTKDVTIEGIVDYALSIRAAEDCRNYILRTTPHNFQSLIYYLTRFANAYKYAPYVIQYPLKHIAMVIFSQLGFYFASVLKENAGSFPLSYLVRSRISGCK